jgi:hypothetical protein
MITSSLFFDYFCQVECYFSLFVVRIVLLYFRSLQVYVMGVVEFQQRGMPHAHIILRVNEEDAPTTAEKINAHVSGKRPGLDQPELRELVDKFMTHSDCNSRVSFLCGMKYMSDEQPSDLTDAACFERATPVTLQLPNKHN